LKSVYSIDNLNTRSNQFYIKTEEGARGQGSRETERERGRESEYRLRKDVASVIKQTVGKLICVDKMRRQHLAGLLLISKMRNLANGVSQG
jgi:hypothetical protein